jgi:hypothetical protein
LIISIIISAILDGRFNSSFLKFIRSSTCCFNASYVDVRGVNALFNIDEELPPLLPPLLEDDEELPPLLEDDEELLTALYADDAKLLAVEVALLKEWDTLLTACETLLDTE